MKPEIQDLCILIFDTLLLFTEWMESHLDLFFPFSHDEELSKEK